MACDTIKNMVTTISSPQNTNDNTEKGNVIAISHIQNRLSANFIACIFSYKDVLVSPLFLCINKNTMGYILHKVY